MQAFAEEGMTYLEPQVDLQGFRSPDGTPWTPDQVLDLYRARLAQPDAKATGMTVRMQLSVLRFTPGAEDQLRTLYELAARHPEIVAVNMVGREDDDKGYPLRFLATMRELRRKYSGVNLSIHAGEVDEPNFHVRDTLLLGADRIGHGVNLITDPETMLLMRHGKQLVEINLISNLLLEYVNDYSKHPFPEYLRFGIPVALSTDDRGMWDSTMSDEFFVAVREFDLSWEEVVMLSRNSIAYGFLPDAEKAALLTDFDRRIRAFERRFADGGLEAVAKGKPQYRGFLCRRYQVCDPDA
jgi:adenosine deaminase CECR1